MAQFLIQTLEHAGSGRHLGSDVMVHRVDNIIQQVDVQFLTEVQQLSGWVVGQHRHFCWHRDSEGRNNYIRFTHLEIHILLIQGNLREKLCHSICDLFV